MLTTTFTAMIAVAASFAAALPSPAQADAPTRVEEPLSKRTDHYGLGTIYQQLGGYGSCGIQNPDSALIAALGNYWMKNQYQSEYCGRLIQVTNTGSDDGVGGKGNTVVVKVQDTCPSCDENHIDFSVGAWNQLTNNAAWGTVNIEWHFCNVNGQC